jgi:hypothetical protein
LPFSVTSIFFTTYVAFGFCAKEKTMQRKLILIGIALSLALAGTAQNNVTLSGYIQDESTGEELIGATI